MGNYRARTAVEIGALIAVITLMTILIRPGQGGEDPRRIHAGVDCARCHMPVVDISETVAVPDASSQCRSCHTPASLTTNSRLPFHLGKQRACIDCHTYHEPTQITVGAQQFHVRFSEQGREALCGSCHNTRLDLKNLSPGHRRAAALFHSDNQLLTGLNASDACLICHTDQAHPGISGVSYDREAPTFQDHGHPFAVGVTPGTGIPGNRIRSMIDPRIPLFGGKMECQTCHDLASQNTYLLVGGMTTTELCQGCHQLDD